MFGGAILPAGQSAAARAHGPATYQAAVARALGNDTARSRRQTGDDAEASTPRLRSAVDRTQEGRPLIVLDELKLTILNPSTATGAIVYAVLLLALASAASRLPRRWSGRLSTQLIAGLALLFYRPFEIDDVLTVLTPSGKEETGTVKRFTLGYTRLQSTNGSWIVVPNSVMLSSVLIKAASTEKDSTNDASSSEPQSNELLTKTPARDG